MAFLIIHSGIKDISTFTAGVKVPHAIITSLPSVADIDTFIATNIVGKGYTTVGLTYDNVSNLLPMFENESLVVLGPLYRHFVAALKPQV
jgi:hypothetical protein